MIEVESKVTVYELDGNEFSGGDYPEIIVRSNWKRSNAVTLVIDGKKYTMLANDLKMAITNATNH